MSIQDQGLSIQDQGLSIKKIKLKKIEIENEKNQWKKKEMNQKTNWTHSINPFWKRVCKNTIMCIDIKISYQVLRNLKAMPSKMALALMTNAVKETRKNEVKFQTHKIYLCHWIAVYTCSWNRNLTFLIRHMGAHHGSLW